MAFRTNKVPAIEERTVSGSSVSFNSAFALPLKACKVSFSATQAGSGDPSPSNPRAISGVSAIGLTANSTPVSVSLGDTRYGGVLDVLTGILTIIFKSILLDGSITPQAVNWKPQANSVGILWQNDIASDKKTFAGNTLSTIICDRLPTATYTDLWGADIIGICPYSTDELSFVTRIPDTSVTTKQLAVQWLQNNPLNVVYELAEPITIQLSPTELSSILGNNTFSTDTGTLEITFADLQEKSASGAIATFNTALAMPLVNGEFSIVAYQEGSGDPSPVNVRNIVGFSEQNIFNSSITPVDKLIPIFASQSGSGNPSPSNVRPIEAGLTITRDDSSVLEIWGGTLNVVTGELISTLSKFVINETKNFGLPGAHATGYSCYRLTKGFNGIPSNCKDLSAIICSDRFETEYSTVYSRAKNYITSFSSGVTQWIISIANEYADAEEQTTTENFKTWLEDNNITVIYELTTPQIIQLSATELQRAKQALGINSYTKQLGETVYGGSYNSVTGKKRKTFGKIVFDGSSDEAWNNYNNGFYIYILDMKIGADASKSKANWLICGVSSTRTGINFGASNNIAYFFHITDNSELFPTVTDRDTWRAYLSEHPLELTYELAEPIETDIGATPISTNIGDNNIFCDTGDTSVVFKDLDIAKRGNFREVFKLPS